VERGNTSVVRERHLDGLRGVAALVIILHHPLIAFDFAFYNGVATEGHAAWHAAMAGWPFLPPVVGNSAVCLFFALSGFVLTSSFHRTRLGGLALVVKRTLRLGIPILAVSLFVWALVAGGLIFNVETQPITHSWWLGVQTAPPANIASALRDGVYGALLGLPGATAYNGSLWTMSVEFFGSLLLISVFVAMRPFRGRRHETALLILVFLALGALGFYLYLSLFAFGAALRLANLRDRLKDLPQRDWIMAGLMVLGVFLGTIPYAQTRGPLLDWLVAHALVRPDTAWQASDGPFRGIPDATFWHAAGALMILVAADCWPALRRQLERWLPQFFGRISFPLYLLHVPILLSVGCGTFLLLLDAGIGQGVAWTLSTALFILTACLLSHAVTPLIEEPAVRWSSAAARHLDGLLNRLWVRRTTRLTPGVSVES
jgi:peptidoglycan/LPS O-acetylase OafA/YrhL